VRTGRGRAGVSACTAGLAGVFAALAGVGCAVDRSGLAATADGGGGAHADALDAAMGGDVPVDGAGGVDAACVPCADNATAVKLPGGRFTGKTSGASTYAGTCGGAAAPEAIYKLQLDVRSDVFVTTHGTGFDTVVYMRRGCCGAEEACNDDADSRRTSVLSMRGVSAGTYYVFVDGANPGDDGDFTVDIYASASSGSPADTCGNPTRVSNIPISGNTCNYQNDYDPQNGCIMAPPDTSGVDQVYYFVLDAAADVTFSTCNNTCIDTVLYIRDECATRTSQVACDDDSCAASGSCYIAANMVQSRVTTHVGAGVHYLVLDTFPASPVPCGAFTITPSGVPP
jgi:hypothetical protein